MQTFDASSIHNLAPIDHARFGDNESLFATLFLGNKAFFVTYLRVDPFHAFRVDDDGTITEMAEFVVSGWNDFFRAVQNEERLVGIGINDENGRQVAVILYDITDLSNPEPLIARAEVEVKSSWSEANWDHRAFSVLEDAVQVGGPNGEAETGLVFLPFTAFGHADSRYSAAVQIFTFLDDFSELAKVQVENWASLRDARVGRALFQVPGGLLVFNLDEPTSARLETFFAARGWPRRILVDGRQIIFAAGQFGIDAFGLDEVNLPPPGSF